MNNLNSITPKNNVLINGQLDGSISAFDRGLAYGDGVFRTFAINNATPHCWLLQYQKLSSDCKAIGIQCPSQELLLKDIQLIFGDKEHAVAKIIITRGESARGYSFPLDIEPSRILIKSALPNYPASNQSNGVCLHLCKIRLAHQPMLAGIKHLNRLENVLARSEWNDADIADGILLDVEGNAIEGTMTNIFARFGKTLVTPATNKCGVSGLARERIISQAHMLGLQVETRDIPLDELMQTDELIICNSLFGAWQAVSFNGKQWKAQSLASQLSAMLIE